MSGTRAARSTSTLSTMRGVCPGASDRGDVALLRNAVVGLRVGRRAKRGTARLATPQSLIGRGGQVPDAMYAARM
jgi:hypothetical protein